MGPGNFHSVSKFLIAFVIDFENFILKVIPGAIDLKLNFKNGNNLSCYLKTNYLKCTHVPCTSNELNNQ